MALRVVYPMKKIIGVAAAAALITVGTKVHRNQRKLFLSPDEQQTLRNAPRDDHAEMVLLVSYATGEGIEGRG
jgi:hypothetical protein